MAPPNLALANQSVSCPCQQFLALCARVGALPSLHPSSARVSIGSAVAALVAAKAAAGYRPAYVRSLRQYLAQFARGRDLDPLAGVSAEDLERWFADRREAASTRAANVGRLSALFAFAVRRGWIGTNPCERLERVRVPASVPAILSPAQMATLLRSTAALAPRALAWLVLAGLAGLRPSEARQTPWQAVRGDLVVVEAAASKVHRRRIVPLQPSAVAWLAHARGVGADLPLPAMACRRWIHQARGWLGLTAWPQDVLRHTAASYLVALHRGDLGPVAAALGNSPRILARHYRELVTAEQAAEFWALRTSQASGV